LDQDVEPTPTPTAMPTLAEKSQKIEPVKTAAMFRLRTH